MISASPSRAPARYSWIAPAARRPDATASMMVLGPDTTSPPAKTPAWPVARVRGSATIPAKALTSMPAPSGRIDGSGSSPTATRIVVAGELGLAARHRCPDRAPALGSRRSAPARQTGPRSPSRRGRRPRSRPCPIAERRCPRARRPRPPRPGPASRRGRGGRGPSRTRRRSAGRTARRPSPCCRRRRRRPGPSSRGCSPRLTCLRKTVAGTTPRDSSPGTPRRRLFGAPVARKMALKPSLLEVAAA